MVWEQLEKLTANSSKAHTGEIHSHSVKRTGLLSNTIISSVALVILLGSLALPMVLSCFGCVSTKSKEEQLRKLEKLNIGDYLEQITRCGISVVNLTQDGLVGLHQNGRRFTQVANGRLHVRRFGRGIMQPVNDVVCIVQSHQMCRSTSITLNRSLTKSCEPLLATSFCYVKSVTISPTLGGM